MKLRRHYILLREAFSRYREGEPLETTTSELAEVLACTNRNMMLLLKRMVEEEWIAWSPKRGRGNRSLLTFIAPTEHLLLDEAKELTLRGDLQAAWNMLKQPSSGTALTEPFQEWLSNRFGFRTEVEGQQRTDIVRFPLPGAIQSLDPAKIHYLGESHLVNQLFDGLARMDAKGEYIIPHLAHAWEANAERTEWLFYLRKGVLFHHGRTMTADDVRYSLERLKLLAPDGLYSRIYNDIDSMDTLDDTTIRIRLRKRNELFLSFLTTNRASIVPRDLCEASGEHFGSGAAVSGTGPFRLASSRQGIWCLDAFSPYFQGRAFLDRVEIWTFPADARNAFQSALAAQQFQVMHNMNMSEAEGSWLQVRQSGATCKFLTVNELKDGPLADPAMRETLHHALRRGTLLKLLGGDDLEETAGFWSDFMRKERPDDGSAPSEPEPHAVADADARAASRLPFPRSEETTALARRSDAAGSGGRALTLATIPQYRADAEAIQAMLESCGLKLRIRFMAAEQFKGEARMEADLLLFAVMLDEHRELRLVDLFQSMQQHLPDEVGETMERQMSAIMSEPNSVQRAAAFIRLEQMLADRHSLLFLYRKQLKTAFHPSVRGIALESLGWVRFRDLWFR